MLYRHLLFQVICKLAGFFTLTYLLLQTLPASLAQQKVRVYLIPGQGADYRLFNNLDLGNQVDTIHVTLSIPDKGMKMAEYARRLALQIDTSAPFVLIGTSFGGMLAVEMSHFLHPEKVILISSAKCRIELPFRYRFQRVIPVYKLFTGKGIKTGARIMQPLVEPDRRKEKSIFKTMLKAKHPKFMKRSVAMIMEWEREVCHKSVFHIHGDADHTLPVHHINADVVLAEGSHMMTLSRGDEVSKIIRKELGVEE